VAKPKASLPKRFAPYAAQAQTETALRYGAQEAAFKSIFDQLTRDSGRNAQAQDTAYRSLLGSLQAAPADLSRVYSDAGLSPQVLATIGNSPTGQRLAGELARGQAGILQQQTGAQAGAQYQQQHIADQYHDDVGKLNDQASALATEKGLYQSSLLDQLIGQDRSARHDAHVEAAKQQFTADENLLDREASRGNALVGAGIDPNTGAVLPGHGPKPKPKPKASPHDQSMAESDFTNALTNAAAMVKGGTSVADAVKALTRGRKAAPGQTIYEDVPVTDSYGNVVKGKTKRQPAVWKDGEPGNKDNSLTGTVKTKGAREAVDAVEPAIAQAAVEMAAQGYLSPATVKHLHDLGYKVRGLPGVKTQFDRPKPAPYPVSRPGTAADPASGQQRPT
jgi:hypothetical protein